MHRHLGNAQSLFSTLQRLRLRHRAVAHAQVAVLLFSVWVSTPSWARDTLLEAPPALEALNQDFRALYRERTQQVLEALPLVLVVQNSAITAVRGTEHRVYLVPLQRYNEARAIIHAALGFHGLMNSLAHAKADSADWTRVAGFLLNLERTRLAADRSSLTADEKAHAAHILDSLRRASSEVLSRRAVTVSAIAGTLQGIEPQLSAITRSVGQAHADTLLDVLRRVQSDASEAEWQNAVAVVTGPMTPRRNNLETAIVAAALGPQHLGTRIFYSENIFSVEGALAYLRTLVGDRELSQQVFGTPHRMWEDLFSPVSSKLVEKGFYTDLAQ